MSVAAAVQAQFDALTKDWPPERRAQLAARVRDDLRRRARLRDYRTPGELAAAWDPRVRTPPHLRLIDEALVDVAAGSCSRLIVIMPPQEGKSSRVVRAGVPFLMSRHPDWRIGVASFAQHIATRWGRYIRRDLRQYGGTVGLTLAADATAAADWELEAGGGLICTGLPLGSITGRPLDCLILDDPIRGPQQADSARHRDDVWEWYTDVGVARLAVDASPVVVVQTRWHEDDLAGRLLAQEPDQWRVVYVPAQAEPPQEQDPPWLVDALGREPGEFLPSARHGRDAEFYENRRARVGERTWAAQYQGRPTPRAGGIWQWEWIRSYRAVEAPPLVRVAVAVDPSAEGGDEAGIVAGGRAGNRHLYVTHDRSGIMSIGEWTRRAWLLALDAQADVLVYEKNLVPAVMLRALRSAWARIRQQALALRDIAADNIPADVTAAALPLVAAALAAQHVPDPDDPLDDADPPAVEAMVAQLDELLPYVDRVLASAPRGPSRLVGVAASRGKVTRAEPVAVEYQQGTVHHVGRLPELEAQLTSWQQGQVSPGRLDALVWLAVHLLGGEDASTTAAPAGQVPTGAGVAARQIGWRPSGSGVPTGGAAFTGRG